MSLYEPVRFIESNDAIDITELANRPPWMLQAACRGRQDINWHPNNMDDNSSAAANAICAECPVQVQCLAHAIEHNEQGIWAGTSGRQRKRMKAARRARRRPSS